jgi:agmatinase
MGKIIMTAERKSPGTISKKEFTERMKLYLTPPGEGVFTVHTGADKKQLLQKKLFTEEVVIKNEVRSVWENNLESVLPTMETVILGITSDTGGGILRGANWGPLYLREYLHTKNVHSPKESQYNKELKAFDIGDIRTIPHLLHDKYLNEETINHCRQSLYGSEKINLPVSPLSIAEDFATHFHDLYPAKKIFMVGGDHSTSYPMVKAFLKAKKAQNKNVALIHFDAHTDLLEERLGIDLCFGSWAYHVLPYLNSPKQFIQLGIRSSGKNKEFWENKFHHSQYWTAEILERGPIVVAKEIIKSLKDQKVDELYVSFDIDCLDSEYAMSTGTPEKNGLSPYEPMAILQELYEHFPITGADLVEIAPLVSHPHSGPLSQETTLLIASQIAIFLIGALHDRD